MQIPNITKYAFINQITLCFMSIESNYYICVAKVNFLSDNSILLVYYYNNLIQMRNDFNFNKLKNKKGTRIATDSLHL